MLSSGSKSNGEGEEEASPLKKIKLEPAEDVIDKEAILTYLQSEYYKEREKFCDHILELFYLEQQGNLMDYYSWRKKPPSPALLQYLKTFAPDDEDFEELKRLKHALDSPLPFAASKTSAHIAADEYTTSSPSPLLQTTSLVSPTQLSTTHSSLSSAHQTPHLTVTSPTVVTTPTVNNTSGIKATVTLTPAQPSLPQSDGKSSVVSNSHVVSKVTSAAPSTPISSVTLPKVISCTTTTTTTKSSPADQTHSISSVYEASIGSQEQIVERAKQEAYVMQRITDLRKEGLWTAKRLPKVQEPPRAKAHWDYLLEEMMWLSADFAQERKWKKAAAKKCARMVVKYHQDKEMQVEKAQRDEQARLRKIAGTLAKAIREFWTNVEKLVEFRQQTRLEEKRKRALDLHLKYIVDQTEKFSSWLAEGLTKGKPDAGAANSLSESLVSENCSLDTNDTDFDPSKSFETDDEETIAKEEAEEGSDSHENELDLLKKESEMPLDELMQSMDHAESSNSSETVTLVKSDEVAKNEDDVEFTVDKDEEDDEETIKEQELAEGNVDYVDELQALQDEADLPIEQLLEKYGNSWADSVPSMGGDNASCSGSQESVSQCNENSGSIDPTEESATIDNCDDIDDEQEESDDPSDQSLSDASEAEEVGMRFLIDPDEESKEVTQESSKLGLPTERPGPSKDITDIAAGAERIQPKGNTLLTTKVATKVPFLLKHTLREYQHIGLDWLAAMYDKKLNGILADEMGLGKTIQTIALLAHLACDKGIWGPHLIVVPTSVMLNWEMEFKKWCPAFKILTYYGSPKERKQKRQGWTKPNQFHVCITSYKLVIQDHQSFRRKKWKYLILDEAQHIKNFKSQRWQMLLNFNTSRRLLLTGTPLQNNLMELWSLMHFLMPNVFASHRDFKDWFVNPVTGMIEGNHEYNEALIRRLHKVLRPFLLRRLKQEVEKQLPKKYEHVMLCRLSKRQRFLYEEFMNLSKTKETLESGNFLSVINVLMQLRKVCNHPNLFETRPTVSPLAMEGLTYHTASLATTPLDYDPFRHVSLDILHSKLIDYSYNLSALAHHRIRKFHATPKLIEEIDSASEPPPRVPRGKIRLQIKTTSSTHPAVLPQAPKTLTVRTMQPHITQTVQTPQAVANSPISTATTIAPIMQLATSVPQPILQNSRFLLFSNASSAPVKTLTSSTSNLMPTTESTMSSASSTPTTSGNILKKLTITTPLTQLGQSSQLGSHKVKIQIGPSAAPMKVVTEPPASRPCTNSSPFLKVELASKKETERKEKLRFLGKLNSIRCAASALYAPDLIDVATVRATPDEICTNATYSRSIYNNGQGYFHCLHAGNKRKKSKHYFCYTDSLTKLIKLPEERLEELKEVVKRFVFVVPPVSSPRIKLHASHLPPSKLQEAENLEREIHDSLSVKSSVLHPIVSNLSLQSPELRLIQYDCGKLQTLDSLLWSLKSAGHRVLIFTQMSRMLDIFEQFLNYHGHTYLRLDGSTKIEQRQALMERFNADKRIFCFILSTRSGGIGVNLTGADTVIFYDSDWNPTMDAQAQDRCHRIGQTRDVHIYRLISEKTVEENILKKAQQKRLLGDVAIEGGNFTTAFFKENSIKELFDVENVPSQPKEEVSVSQEADLQLQSQLEQALEDAEEAPDVAAAKTARAEAAAEFAEFDETIPIDNDTRDSEEKTSEEKELDRMIEQLTPVERYAMQFLESIQEPTQAEQLKQAEEEIEAHKKEWELGRLKSLKEEEERVAAQQESEREELLTLSRDDAYDQVYISYQGLEQMPVWAPPTPPQDENDLYIDYSAGFLYESSIMPESHLPPVYLPKDAKRLKIDSSASTRHKQNKLKKEDIVNIPRSLFDKPSSALLKLRKELKIQKLRGLIAGGPDPLQMQKLLNALGTNIVLPQPTTIAQQAANSKSQQLLLQGLQQENQIMWGIHEDWTILHAIQFLQEIPLNLLVLSLGHIPNWDLVSDVVNSIACTYRSPKMCRHHYESVILQREEGKLLYDPSNKKMKKQQKLVQASGNATGPPTPTSAGSSGATPKSQPRPMRTSHIYSQDANYSFSQMCSSRFETIKQIANKRTPTLKPFFVNSTGKNSKHIALLQENGIGYEQPLTPMQVALNRAERIAKEKAKNHQQQQLAAAEQLRQKQQQQQPLQQSQQQIQTQQQQPQQLLQIKQQGQIKATVLSSGSTLQPAQQQFQQSIQAKVAALSQNSTGIAKTTNFISNVTQAASQQQQSVSEKQQVANIAKVLSQAAASYSSSTQQTQLSSASAVLPEGTRITSNNSAMTIPTAVQEVSSGSTSQPVSTQLSQPTGAVISVSTLPQQTQQKILAVAITPSNQVTAQIATTKLTPAQLQTYKQQLLRQQQARQLQQAQQVAQQIQIQQTSQQLTQPVQFQQVSQQQQQAVSQQSQQQSQQQQQIQRLQFSGSITQQTSPQVSQQSQSLIATTSIKPVSTTTVMTSGGLPVAVPLASGQQQRIFTTTKPQQLITRTTVTEAELAQLLSRGQRTQTVVTSQPSTQASNATGTQISSTSSSSALSTQLSQTTPTVISVSALPPQTQQKILAVAITPQNQVTQKATAITTLTQAQLQSYKQQLLRHQQARQLQAQQVAQQIQIQQTSQQISQPIQFQQVSQQQQTQQIQRLQFSSGITQQNTGPQVTQSNQSLIATTSIKPVTATAVMTTSALPMAVPLASIATSSIKPVTAAAVMTSGGLPVAVPLASGQQQRIFTTAKPQQLIARTTVSEAELAQLLSRTQRPQTVTPSPQTSSTSQARPTKTNNDARPN